MVAQYPKLVEDGLEGRLNSADVSLRLICFSSEQASPQNEILLWSHYANKHQGHRIGFKIPESAMNGYSIASVKYLSRRVEVDYTGDSSDPRLLAALSASIDRKCRVWAYEREFRLAINPELCVPDEVVPQMEHFPFDPAWVVRVDCGRQSDQAKDARIVAVVKERYPHASVYKAQFHPTDYSIEYALIHAGS